jgi:hypothetical protein
MQANHRPRDRSVSLTENLPRVSTCLFQVAKPLRDAEQGNQGPILLISAGSERVDGMGERDGIRPNPGCASAISRPLPSHGKKHYVRWKILRARNTYVCLPEKGWCVRLLEVE